MSAIDNNIGQYLEQLPEKQRDPVAKLRAIFKRELEPLGFEETMQYGMITYVVPYSLYPAGYHCKPKLPLPFLSLAGQKQHISIYHLGIYANEQLLSWFKQAFFESTGKNVDMGKSCIRLKATAPIPYGLLASLAQKISAPEWVQVYELSRQKK